MPKDHVAQPGDYLLRLAEAEGFHDFHTIWDDSANAALKKERVNPNVLAPKDKVVVPDKSGFETTRESQATHQFKLKGSPTILNVHLETAGFQPRADRKTRFKGTVAVGTKVEPVPELDGVTKPDGTQTIRSVRPLVTGELRLLPGSRPTEVDERLPLLIAHLAPLTSRAGQRQRLNNLGYFAGFRETELTQFQWAVEEFQTDHRRGFPRMKRLGLEPDGSVDKETLIALGTVHGDMLPGQDATL